MKSPPEDIKIVKLKLQKENSKTAGPESQKENNETIKLNPLIELFIEK